MAKTHFTRKDFELHIPTPLGDLPQRVAAWKQQIQPPAYPVLYRLALYIDDPALQAEPLEQQLASALVDAIVRVSRVLPRVAAAALTLPVRVLVVDGADAGVRPAIERVFGKSNAPWRDLAMVAEETTLEAIATLHTPNAWPNVDILHFGRFPISDRTAALSQAPGVAGNIRWINRAVDVWQTRLVIFDVRDDAEAALARELGAMLVARGGPAVIVRRAGDPHPLYDRIIHDFPLDDITGLETLFGGEGREELLRVSNVAENVTKAIETMRTPPAMAQPPVRKSRTRGWGSIFKRRQPVESFEAVERPRPTRERITDFGQSNDLASALTEVRSQKTLDDFSASSDQWTYSLRESDGFIPMARALDTIRREAVSRSIGGNPPQPASRYVNGSLWSHRNGKAAKLDARSEHLIIGELCHLRIQIGPRDFDLPFYRASAVIDDQIKWTPEMRGVWLEIAVTGIGFDVDPGTDVQELWLPRMGPSEPVYFALTPRTSAPVVRYTIYCNGSVVQTFRLAALAGDGERTPEREALAAALGIPLEELPAGTYVTRLDYGGGIDDADGSPQRAFAIVANHTAGKRVVTLKGQEFKLDNFAGDIEDLVGRTRDTLFDNSVNRVAGLDRKDWQYAYSDDPQVNETRLRAALPELADLGWQMYDRLFKLSARNAMEPVLDRGETTIQVAHTLLEEVIPWSAVYDRGYDSGMQFDVDGNPVAHDVCLAALPDANGVFPATKCGTLPSCLLHPAQCAARKAAGQPALVEETVACPLHFWGFRHVIEIPPQQPEEDGQPVPRRATIQAGPEAQLAAGINAALPLAQKHLDRLAQLVNRHAKWRYESKDRDAVLQALKDLDLDVIYFYCHARGGMADANFKPPCIEFQTDANAKPGHLIAANFNNKTPWPHAPIVFLNGCSTAAFSPDAMSPFIRKFVDLGASGAIGTEIPVHEALAGAAGFSFLDRFLGGTPAGPALLAVRRELLSQRNPLGLVYTLYAYAELSIVHSA